MGRKGSYFLKSFGDRIPRTRHNQGQTDLSTRRKNRALGQIRLFECIRARMKKGSPEGYNAENGSEQPAQKPQTGEPNERQPLYRIRCPQEKRQLLRERGRRADLRRRQAASDAPGVAAVGPGTPGSMEPGR